MSTHDVAQEPDLAGQTLLVLGAAGKSKPGLYQAAQRRGLRILLVKAEPADWEREQCADVLPLDCQNHQNLDRFVPEVLDFARETDGTITTFDAAVPALAQVALQLGVVGVPPETASVLRDKHLMREHFRRLGLPSARSVKANTWQQTVAAADEIGYPVVIKPVIGTGSAGVLLARTPDELCRADGTARKVAQALHGTSAVLVEEYLDGLEVCVDSLVHHGNIIFENITDHPPHRHANTFEGVEYVTPTSLGHHLAQEVYQLNRRTIESLQLSDAVSHTEIMVTTDGPRLIETHPRVAGHRMPEITHRALGVDLFGAAIDIAMAARPTIVPQRHGYAAYRCLCPYRSGTLRALRGTNKASQLPGIFDVDVQIQPGAHVTALPDAVQQNIAFILAHAPTYQAARDRARAAEHVIEATITQSEP